MKRKVFTFERKMKGEKTLINLSMTKYISLEDFFLSFWTVKFLGKSFQMKNLSIRYSFKIILFYLNNKTILSRGENGKNLPGKISNQRNVYRVDSKGTNNNRSFLEEKMLYFGS